MSMSITIILNLFSFFSKKKKKNGTCSCKIVTNKLLINVFIKRVF